MLFSSFVDKKGTFCEHKSDLEVKKFIFFNTFYLSKEYEILANFNWIKLWISSKLMDKNFFLTLRIFL